MIRAALFAAAAAMFSPLPAAAQFDPAPLLAAQREAMKPLAAMDGMWRGPAWTITPAGRKELTQTERIGPLLDGTIKLVEGRGYGADGATVFNAFAVIAFDPMTRAYSIHSYAQGFSGTFPMTLTPDGYVWEVPAGPGAKIRYTATIGGGKWREIGERIAGDGAPVQIFEMNLVRIGDGTWPSDGAVPPK